MPGIVEEERALGADGLQLVALGERRAAVEEREHVAGKPHQARECPVRSGRADVRLAEDRLRLAAEQARAAHAVAADVHQAPALDVRAQADVVDVVERIAEGRADHPELPDRSAFDELDEPVRLRVVAIHERFAEETTRPLSGIEGPRHLVRPAVERLLAEDVLSRLERADRPLHVHRVRQRDVDRLDVCVLEQRVVRAVRALDAPLARVRLGTALVAAGNGDQIDLLRRLRSRNQLPVDVGGREEPPANRHR